MNKGQYGIIGAIQAKDPPCPYKDKPCDKWHFETIERGGICPCNCHFTKQNSIDMICGFGRIENANEVLKFG